MRERNELDDRLSSLVKIEKDLRENLELAEMGEAEGDTSIVDEAQAALTGLKNEVKQRQFEALFSGEADSNDTCCLPLRPAKALGMYSLIATSRSSE